MIQFKQMDSFDQYILNCTLVFVPPIVVGLLCPITNLFFYRLLCSNKFGIRELYIFI